MQQAVATDSGDFGSVAGRVIESGLAEPLIHRRVGRGGEAAAMGCCQRGGCGIGMKGAGRAPTGEVAEHRRRPPLVGGQNNDAKVAN